MKIIIFVSLISAAIALPKPAVIQVPEQVETIPSITLQAPALPETENNKDGIVYHVKIVDSIHMDETITKEDANVVIAPEEPFEKIVPLNNEMLSDIKGRILQRLGNKINDFVEPGVAEFRDAGDVIVVQEPDVSEFSDNSNVVVVEEAENPQSNDQVQVEDSDVDVVQESEVPQLDDQVQVEDSDVDVVQESEVPQFDDQVQVEDSYVVVVQEPENHEFNDQVQVEDSPISDIAQDDNIVTDFFQDDSENVQVVDNFNILRDNVLKALVNKFNTIRFNNIANKATEPEVPEFHDQVHVVDSPILSEIAKDDNIVSDFDVENVNVVNGPILLSNHVLNHGVVTVPIVNNQLFDMFQTPHVQQVIIVGSPLEIVEAVHKIIEHVHVVQTPAFNDPPRIFKFPNPLLR